ncbi:MAG: pyruvate, phosphate dikinase/phosphoenolpyruvate synthase regulator [Chloroflexi bacterium]|nr:pyruvate, phosphate dikinase/phosphoenolpyruvate synthase regulator [Chloroflexota bacterium]
MTYPQYPPELIPNAPPVYVLTGGQGAIGRQVIETVCVQFAENDMDVKVVNKIKEIAQLEEAVERAVAEDATIVHTMIDPQMRSKLIELCEVNNLVEFDLIGPLMDHLSQKLGVEPMHEPGRYHKLNEEFFERVKAVEYTLAHDDGKHPVGWPEADIVIVAPSRCGKTPLSMYLGDMGKKVANVPLLPGVPPPKELAAVNSRRVFGLTVEPDNLRMRREARQRSLGTGTGPSDYTDVLKVYEEVDEAERLYKKSGYTKIDMTETPIEAAAEEILGRLERRFRDDG